MPPNGQIIIANARGQEVGTTFAGFSSMMGMGTEGGYTVGPWMYGLGAAPYMARDDPPPARAIDIRRMLSIDGKAQQVYEALTQAVRAAKWEVTQGFQAEWVRGALDDLDPPMDMVIAQMASATAYARALFEVVYDTDELGRVAPVRVAYRPPDNTILKLDEQGKPAQLEQNFKGTTVQIPLERALIYLHNQHRAPGVGISDMEPIWVGHWEKKNIRAMWRIFIARTAQPWTVAKASVDHPQAMRSMAQRIATIKSGGVVGIANNEEVSTLDAGGRAGAVFQDALDWVDRQATQAVLAQFLDLGQTRVGSFALSRDHSDFFTLGRDAMLREMATVLTDQLVRRMILVNFPNANPDQLPAFRFEPLAEADASQMVTLLGQIMAAPSLNPAVPQVFVDQLVQRVALLLGLDADQIVQAAPGDQATAQAAQLAQNVLAQAQTPQPTPAANGAGP